MPLKKGREGNKGKGRVKKKGTKGKEGNQEWEKYEEEDRKRKKGSIQVRRFYVLNKCFS